MTSRKDIKSVVIVGGGTAGWISACHLAKKLNARTPKIQVMLVESPNIPTIGVGEGTVPMLRETLKYFGIREDDFIHRCDVTFKQSVKFIDWNEPNSGEYYHHLFDYPYFKDFTSTWLNKSLSDRGRYADLVSVQGHLIDAGFGPKAMTQPQYRGAMHYAYHLDAAKFTKLLTEFGVERLGVKHLLAEVIDTKIDAQGNILELHTDNAGVLTADLYVDCTGFSAQLIGSACNVPFVDKSDILFVDSALVVQLPYEDKYTPIPCFTKSTAQEAGWIWDIGLSERRGVGYVYSSQYSSIEQAESVLREYLGKAAEEISFRHIPMKVGYREKSWQGNCVAIGLSSGFVEPLEATGLLMFDATARMLAECFPANTDVMPLVANRYNQRVSNAWNRVIDFIKLHYVTAKRMDTPFWVDNKNEISIPDSLKEHLELWRYHIPTAYDFTSTLEFFNLENYLYVLYGSDFESKLKMTLNDEEERLFSEMTDKLDKQVTLLKSQLLPHRELIERIKLYGIQLN